MANIDIKTVRELKDTLVSGTRKGFGYYMRNVLLIALIVIGAYIVANPSIIRNPKEFISTFDPSSIYILLILLGIFIACFYLCSNLFKDTTTESAYAAMNDYENVKKVQYNASKEEHARSARKRIENATNIVNVLKDLLIKLDASRSTICEMHNGTNNLSGLPFVYLSMMYEEINPTVSYISEEYSNFNMTRFPFICRHYTEGTWIGSRSEIEQEDAHFGAKLMFDDTKYFAAVVIHGKEGPLGFLTVSFASDEHPTKTQISQELTCAAQKISLFLDK